MLEEGCVYCSACWGHDMAHDAHANSQPARIRIHSSLTRRAHWQGADTHGARTVTHTRCGPAVAWPGSMFGCPGLKPYAAHLKVGAKPRPWPILHRDVKVDTPFLPLHLHVSSCDTHAVLAFAAAPHAAE